MDMRYYWITDRVPPLKKLMSIGAQVVKIWVIITQHIIQRNITKICVG
jgi:hypothetical protein